MKRTSKLIVLLAAIGMLVGCSPKGGKSSKSEPSNVANDINVAYIKSYVSDKRAEEMKQGYIASLKESGVTVDESKINFFTTENSTVAAYADEILAHNEENPDNQIDAILGARSFDNAEEESRTAILEKYDTDGVDYKYGTHSKDENKYNRRFFYDKAKAENPFVKGLHKYLQDEWSEYIPPEPEETGKLVVMTYSVYVDDTRFNEIKNGFTSYLTEKHKTIATLEFIPETETTSISDFMGKVDDQNEANPDKTVDVLLGLKSNSAITDRGFSNDGLDYNYGTKAGDEAGNATRRFWYKELTTEVQEFQAYMRAYWTEPQFRLVGSMNDWNTEDTTYSLAKEDANTYSFAGFQATAGTELKVYWLYRDVYFRNATAPEDCGYTIGEAPDYNVIITAAGSYNVTFRVSDPDENHISFEAQLLPTFRVAFYNKFISEDNENTIKSGLTAAFAAAHLDLEYKLDWTDLGTGNYTSMKGNIVAGTQVILGCKNDSNASGAIGGETGAYEIYSEQAYTYGNDATRVLWVLKGSKTNNGVIAVFNYLEANWKAAEA